MPVETSPKSAHRQMARMHLVIAARGLIVNKAPPTDRAPRKDQTMRLRPVNFIDSRKAARKAIDELVKYKWVAVDSEFNEKYLEPPEIEIWSYSWGKGSRYVVTAEALEHYYDWFCDPKFRKVYQNFPADYPVFAAAGIPQEALKESFGADIMCMHHNRFPNNKFHGLKYQGLQCLHWPRKEYSQLFSYVIPGQRKPVVMQPREIMRGPLPECALAMYSVEMWKKIFKNYSADDAEETAMLFDQHRKVLIDWDYWKVHLAGDREFALVLLAVAARGMPVDLRLLQSIKRMTAVEQMRYEHVFRRLSGQAEMSLHPSSKKLKEYIFNELEWPTYDDLRTKSGAPQLNRAALERYIDDYGFSLAKSLDGYRKATTQFAVQEALERGALENPEHIVHTEFNQVAANTTRISSRKLTRIIEIRRRLKRGGEKIEYKKVKVGMQLQNIPIRVEKDPHKLRRVFIAGDGEVVVCADYAGFELMMNLMWAARICPDSIMLKLMLKYGTPSAIHAYAAKMMLNIKATVDEIVAESKGRFSDQYDMGKRCDFNLQYGGGAKMLCKIFGWDVRREQNVRKADKLRTKWFRTFPEIEAIGEWWVNFAYKKGYVYDITGQRFDLNEYLDHPDDAVRFHGERKAKNTPCQASAAKITRQAMIDIEKDEELKRLGYLQRLPVHDEILGTAPRKGLAADYALERVITIMRAAAYKHKYKPQFKIKVSGKIADNWYAAK